MNDVLGTNKRDVTIDIIKGLGIVFMVLGHSYFPFQKFIYLFHMAIFFIASGYLYNEKYSDNIKSVIHFIGRKFKSLWFPYVLWTTIFTLLNNVLIKCNIYTDNPMLLEYVSGTYIHTTDYMSLKQMIINIIKSFFLSGHTQLGGAFWFISTLMKLLVFYCIVDYLLKKIIKHKYLLIAQIAVSVVLLAFGYFCSLKGYTFLGFAKVCSYYYLIVLGIFIKRYKISEKISASNISYVVILVLSFVALLILENFGSIGLDTNHYTNPLFFIAVSFIGWEFCFTISCLIKKVKISSAIAYLGKNTMPIIILHFLSFKIVSLVGILIDGSPMFLLAAFPVLYEDGIWWIAYSLVGILIPIVFNYLYINVKNRIVNLIKSKKFINRVN